jgi:tetratricopeptide (TPR) repeat protein
MHARAATILPMALVACLAAECAKTDSTRTSTGVERPHILLVTIDTLRADRVGVGVAPTLDRLASRGVQFTAARTAVPLTLPSHTTLMTGLWPPAHGVRENGVDRLSSEHATLATLLKGAGYRTAGFVGAFVLDRRFGLSQGFDTYDDQIPRDPNATDRLEAERPASAVVDRALGWLDGLALPPSPAAGASPASPFFVWIHLYDPHAPYNPPAAFLDQVTRLEAGRRAQTSDEGLRYDGEVAYADSQVGRVLEWLRAHALVDRTLVVVAGDHGEGLTQHGERTHGMLLYDSTLRVPLIIAAPHHTAARVEDAVSLVDVAPTILRVAGVAAPAAMAGHDLLAIGARTADADVYSETEYPRVAGWSPLQALTDRRWKTIRASGGAEVYDLQSDPAEQHDLAGAEHPIVAAMTTRIETIRANGGSAAQREAISAETAERLRALGYVAGGSGQPLTADAPNPATQMAAWSTFEDALNAVNARQSSALTLLKPLAAAHLSAPVFQMTYARALKDAGDVAAALDVDRAAAKRWPTDAALLHDVAAAAREAAHRSTGASAAPLLDEASRAERAALVLAPESATSHNGLGLVAVDAGQPRDAVQEFERATALDAGNASYWVNLGNARRALRDTPGAAQAYHRALDADPRSADAANGLGVLLVEASQNADAVAWFERAIASSPDFVEARLNLGIALQQSGQPGRAAAAYRQVLAAPARFTRERDAAAKLLASLRARR